jgi:decaprenylphospho-beta-D-erythro-pentofuranosid-2-ulose 2-reductase
MSGSVLRVLALGGTSEIGTAILRELAADTGIRAVLLDRGETRLAVAASELRDDERAAVSTYTLDFLDVEETERMLDKAFAELDRADVVIVAVGSLGGAGGLDADPREVAEVLESTFVVAGQVLNAAARRLRDQGSGALVVLSSEADVRVRAGDALYGAARAGLDSLASGVGDLGAETGVRVLVVRPGFVVGRMSAGLPRPPFATSPATVARATAHALADGRRTVWVPRIMQLVSFWLRLLPRGVSRRLPW